MLPVVALVASATVLLGACLTSAADLASLQLGMSLTLTAVFGLIWIFGIRYPDVGWMVVLTAILPLETALRPEGAQALVDTWRHVAIGAARFAVVLAFGAFLATFFRRSFRPGRLEAILGLLLAVFVLVGASLAPAEFAALGLGGAFQSYAAAVLLGYGALHGLFSLAPLPPKRQRYVGLMAITCGCGAVTYGLDARFGAQGDGPLGLLMSHALVGIFALFLLADLIIFHRNYFKDKASRVGDVHEAAQREARLELGRTVQDMLMPKEREGRFGGFSFEFLFRPAPLMDGDWLFAWDDGAEKRFVFGHLAAKGAQAALGVAAVISFLREAMSRGLGLGDTARFLNFRIIDLFDRQVTTTFLAASVADDGTVELFNCGGPGFFTVSRDGIRRYPLSSTPLGVAAAFELASCPIPLEDGDVLFAATEGLLGEDQVARVVDFYEDALDYETSREAVRNVVLCLAAPAADADQTLLTIQRLAA